MPIYNSTFSSKLPEVPTSIFSVMSAWAHQENALNLAQGFPDFESDPKLIELVHKAMRNGNKSKISVTAKMGKWGNGEMGTPFPHYLYPKHFQ